jgi:hypothetical protein
MSAPSQPDRQPPKLAGDRGFRTVSFDRHARAVAMRSLGSRQQDQRRTVEQITDQRCYLAFAHHLHTTCTPLAHRYRLVEPE